MNRHYSRQHYIDLIQKYRETVPGISIASDIIVGFCGETESEFEETKDLLQEIRFKNNYIFQYSPRPKTQAEKSRPDDVPVDVKRRRNHELLALQNQIALEDNQRFVGQTVEILIEGPSKKPHLNNNQNMDEATVLYQIPHGPQAHPTHLQLVGRTRGDYITVFNGSTDLIGQTRHVKINKVSAVTLFGQLV